MDPMSWSTSPVFRPAGLLSLVFPGRLEHALGVVVDIGELSTGHPKLGKCPELLR